MTTPVDHSALLLSLERDVAALKAELHECQAHAARLARENAALSKDRRESFEEAPLPCLHEGLDGRFIRANAAARRMLGITPEEAAGALGETFVAPTADNQRRLQQAFARVGPGEQPTQVELELRRQDNGEPIWVEWWSRLDSSGRFTRTTLVDISERVRSEQTRAALELSLESGQVGIWELDLVQGTSRRSLRHDQCFGYASAVPERDWGVAQLFSHVHGDDRSQVEASFRRTLETLQDWRAEFRAVWSDGSVHWLALRGRIHQAGRGHATRMLGIVMDISEQKKSEDALRASEELSRGQVSALKGTLDALALEPAPDRLGEHVSRTITEQFGAHSVSAWSRSEASGMIGFEFAYEEGRIVSKADRTFAGMNLWLPMEDVWPWVDVFTTGKPSVIEDIRDVAPFSLRDRLLPLGIVTVLLIPMSVGGRLEGAIGVRFTEKRSFRPEELELAQALANQVMLMIQFMRLSTQTRQGAVLAERNRIARDIHDTLAQGFTGVIVQLEAAEDAQLRGLLEPADEHLRRARALARESLNEARRSVRALRPRALDEHGLAGALESLFQSMTRGTTLHCEFTRLGEPRPLPAEWEANLFRVAQEILTNALRHALATRFTATLVFGQGDIRLDLRDDGRGFQPAVSSDGFGLLGIRERVEDMGGQITIRSAPGNGTTIIIALPTPGALESQSP